MGIKQDRLSLVLRKGGYSLPRLKIVNWMQPEELKEAKELYMKGTPCSDIAKELGRSVSGVTKALANELVPKKYTKFTAYDDQRILSMRRDGYSLGEIALKLNRTYASVKNRIAVLSRSVT